MYQDSVNLGMLIFPNLGINCLCIHPLLKEHKFGGMDYVGYVELLAMYDRDPKLNTDFEFTIIFFLLKE